MQPPCEMEANGSASALGSFRMSTKKRPSRYSNTIGKKSLWKMVEPLEGRVKTKGTFLIEGFLVIWLLVAVIGTVHLSLLCKTQRELKVLQEKRLHYSRESPP